MENPRECDEVGRATSRPLAASVYLRNMRGSTLGRAILFAIGALIALAALALLLSVFAPRNPRRETFPLGGGMAQTIFV